MAQQYATFYSEDTVIFVLMGAGAGGVGRLLIEYRDVLMIAAGVFIAFKRPCRRRVRQASLKSAPKAAPKRAGAGRAFLTGAALAIGLDAAWATCSAPSSPWPRPARARSRAPCPSCPTGLGVPFVLVVLAGSTGSA